METETYSVLQTSLDQRVGRDVLEEISLILPSVARYDSHRISRGQFGVLISRLPRAEAMAFHRQLKEKGFGTEVVADRELPVLPESFPIRGLKPGGEALVVADSIGREMGRPVKDLVFVAAGYVNRLRSTRRPKESVRGFDLMGRAGGGKEAEVEYEYSIDRRLEFRLDLFFWKKPQRMHVSVREDSLVFFHERPIYLRNGAGLTGLMLAMADLVPAERLNQVLRDPLSAGEYPALSDYEEEIRWHFHQIGKRGA